jgi:hypothetical protein
VPELRHDQRVFVSCKPGCAGHAVSQTVLHCSLVTGYCQFRAAKGDIMEGHGPWLFGQGTAGK